MKIEQLAIVSRYRPLVEGIGCYRVKCEWEWLGRVGGGRLKVKREERLGS